MLTFIGFVVVSLIILYKRSSEIITVNPLHGVRRGVRGAVAEDEPQDNASESLDFGRLLSTVQQAAEQASRHRAGGGDKLPVNQGRAAILKMVENNQFIEAMQLYRRLYGVDLAAAKKAVDKMMLER